MQWFIMSEGDSKTITIFVKDLSFKSDQHVVDLIRFLAEALPQIKRIIMNIRFIFFIISPSHNN